MQPTNTVPLTFKQLFPIALRNDSLSPYVEMLLQWAEQADKEIDKLQEEITRCNFERSGQFEKPDFQGQLTLF